MIDVQIEAPASLISSLPPTTSRRRTWQRRRGFLLLSIGASRRQLLWDCIDSIRRHYPYTPIHVISDAPILGDNITCEWVSAWTGTQSRFLKTQIHRFTPFETTVFVNDDTVVHRPFGEAQSWLGDADVAMAPNFPRSPLRSSCVEFRNDPEMRALCKGREDWVYHNSGVIVFRKSVCTNKLFITWHEEWLRTQATDQPPLLCARVRTGVPIRTLPGTMNYIPHHRAKGKPVSEWHGAQIVHWTMSKRSMPSTYFRALNLRRGRPPAIYDAFKNAVDNGLCDRTQYVEIGRAIRAVAPARVLVFGAGADSLLWKELNASGRTLFVEDSEAWAGKARNKGCDVTLFAYPTLRGVRADEGHLGLLEAAIGNHQWDLIVIDGPAGAHNNSPGRELPIMYARSWRPHPMVILHDFDRPWEQTVAARHLGPPDYTLPGIDRRGMLAVWRRPKTYSP